MNNVLIVGSNGQDGQLLTEKYLKNGRYRNLLLITRKSIKIIKNDSDVSLYEFTSRRELERNVMSIIEVYKPRCIYYLAAYHCSFEKSMENRSKTESRYVNLNYPLRLFQHCDSFAETPSFTYASSSLIFSKATEGVQNENTQRAPSCDYSEHKVECERKLLERFCGNATINIPILYNHESIYRKKTFFTAKVLNYCIEYHKYLKDRKVLRLFNPTDQIDMGYAPEYVDAMMMLNESRAYGSFIVATGSTVTVEDFVHGCFKEFGISSSFVEFQEVERRSNVTLIGNSGKIFDEMNWAAATKGGSIMRKLSEDYKKKFMNQTCLSKD